MDNDSQPHGAPQDPQTGASSAPSGHFINPMNNAGAHDMPQNPSAIGNSVVHDLMRVYESLTQSSTPQVSSEDANSKPSAEPSQSSYGATPLFPPQQFVAHTPGTSYTAPPAAMYPSQAQNSYSHSQQLPQPIPGYYSDPNFSQQAYAMPPNEHLPQHGYGMPWTDGQGHPQSVAETDQDDTEDAEAEDSHEGGGRSKRKRRGSDHSGSGSGGSRGQKGRKKSKASDGRWSKRFTWPDDLHRDFVSAIFDVGLKHSSPSTILEHMPAHEEITTERIKSHLQKYRMHRVKSKKEFISSYEASLRKLQKGGPGDAKSVSGSETAAHLTYSEINGGAITADSTVSSTVKAAESHVEQKQGKHEALMLPRLTETEKASPVGSAMGYLMGLFFSLKQQLMIQRAAEAAKANAVDSPVQDVFDSFVGGGMGANNTAVTPEGSNEQHTQGFDGNAVKPAPPQSVRTNIEENSMMKREMQSQMRLQNKMRALKQQELNKYKNVPSHSLPEKAIEGHAATTTEEDEEKMELADHSRLQGAGETAGNDDGRNRGLSIGASDDFWNTDSVDEQLFEFLMNN